MKESDFDMIQERVLMLNQAVGVEILENLKGPFLDFYYSYRQQIRTFPYDKANLLVLKGRSGAAKDGVDKQLDEWEKGDSELQDWLNRKGLTLPVWRVKFSSAMLAAQLSGRIPKTFIPEEGRYDVSHRIYQSGEFREGAQLMGEVVGYGVYGMEGLREIRIQPSPPTATIINNQFCVENDRGDSVEYWLAQNFETNTFLHILALLRDNISLPDILAFRHAIARANKDNLMEVLARYQFHPHLIMPDGTQQGDNFSEDQINWLLKVLPRSMAPSSAVEKSDREQKQIIDQLHQLKVIKVPTELMYYQHFRNAYGALGLKNKHFHIIPNTWIGGEKNYYYHYGQGFGPDDLVAKLYPALNEIIL